MTHTTTLKTLLATSVLALSLATAFAQGTGHFNIIGRTQMAPGGHGVINVDGGSQPASSLELSINDGPLNITRVVIHFADVPKIKDWPSPISPRTAADWTSRPINWPSGKVHKVSSVEYWYSGKTGKNPHIDLLGLQK